MILNKLIIIRKLAFGQRVPSVLWPIDMHERFLVTACISKLQQTRVTMTLANSHYECWSSRKPIRVTTFKKLLVWKLKRAGIYGSRDVRELTILPTLHTATTRWASSMMCFLERIIYQLIINLTSISWTRWIDCVKIYLKNKIIFLSQFLYLQLLVSV